MAPAWLDILSTVQVWQTVFNQCLLPFSSAESWRDKPWLLLIKHFGFRKAYFLLFISMPPCRRQQQETCFWVAHPSNSYECIISRTPWGYCVKFGANVPYDSRTNCLEFWCSEVTSQNVFLAITLEFIQYKNIDLQMSNGLKYWSYDLC